MDQVRWLSHRDGVTDFELLSRDERVALRAAVRTWLAGDDPARREHNDIVDRLVLRHRENVPRLERTLRVLEERLPAVEDLSQQADRAFNRDAVLTTVAVAGFASGFIPAASIPLRAAAFAATRTSSVVIIDVGLTHFMAMDMDTGPDAMKDLLTDVSVGSTLDVVGLIAKGAPESVSYKGVMRRVDRIGGATDVMFRGMDLYVTWSIRQDHREALRRLRTDIDRLREAVQCLRDESQECVDAVRQNLSGVVRDLSYFVDEGAAPMRSGPGLARSVVDEVVRRVVKVVRDNAPDVLGARSLPVAPHEALQRAQANGIESPRQEGPQSLVQFDQDGVLKRINTELAHIPGAFGTLEVLPVGGRDLRERFRLRVDVRREVLGAMAAVAATVELTPQEDGSAEGVAFDVVRFKADARVEQRGLYEGAIEYGYDRDQGYEAAGGVVRVQDLFDLELFFIAPSTTGFVAVFSLGLGSQLPVTIPVGATGFALKRVRGHFAHNFSATLGSVDTENLTADDVAAWIKTNDADPFRAWQRVDEGRGYAGGFGLSADFVTLPDSGFLMTLQDLGFGYFTEGPVVYLRGSGRLLDTASLAIDATALILPKSGTINVSATAELHVPSDERGRDAFKIVSARGGADFRASLANPRSWYVHLGHRDRPIRGALLQNLLTAEAFFMVDHTAIETGGRVHAGRSMSLGPFGVSGQFGMAVDTRLGWNPIQVSTRVEILGALSACLWRWCLGLGLGAQISATLVRPTFLEVSGHVSIRLPFRRRSVSASGVILRYDPEDQPKPEVVAPLQLLDESGITPAASEESIIRVPEHGAEPRRTVLGAFHHLTGKQWQLTPGASDPIWPDAELVIPFVQSVGCRVGEQTCDVDREHDPDEAWRDHDSDEVWIVNPQPSSPLRSGGYTITHRLTRLQVNEIDDEGSGRPVRGLNGGWAAIDGEPGGVTHRLHLPMRTPFDWLNPYPTLRHLATPAVERSTVVGFGTGDTEVVLAPLPIEPVVVLPSLTARPEWPNRIAPRRFAPLVSGAGLKPGEAAQLERMMGEGSSTRALIAARGDESVQIRLRFAVTDDDGSPVHVIGAAVVITSALPLDPSTVLDASTVQADGSWARLDGWFAAINDNLDAGESGFTSTVDVTSARGPFDELTLSLSSMDAFEVEVAAVVLRHPGAEALGGTDPEPWRPGRYELSIAGTTTVAGHGLTSHDHAWAHSQPFEVVAIPTLRPYVFDTTLGDSRMFRGETAHWNPTPFGLGFPAYRQHRGVVRLRSPRVDKLAAFRAPDDADGEPEITVVIDGHDVTPSFRPTAQWPVTEAIQAWLRNHGRRPMANERARSQPPQELVFDAPTGHLAAGTTTVSTLTIERTWRDADGTRESTKLDEWAFAVSRFDSIDDHLRLPNALAVVDTAYSHRGRARLVPPPPLTIVSEDAPELGFEVGGDVSAETVDALLENDGRPERALEAKDVPRGWRLDESLTSIVRGPDGDGALGPWSALGFLRAAHWAGIRVGTGVPMDGLLEPPSETEIALVKTPYGGERPLMLWLRTPEPIDWRRMQASITVLPVRAADGKPPGTYQAEAAERLRFSVDTLPSPDGSSVLLLLRTPPDKRNRPHVFWPQGLYRLTFRYAFVQDDVTRLPWLRERDLEGGNGQEAPRWRDVHLRLLLVSGEPWPSATDSASRVGGRHP